AVQRMGCRACEVAVGPRDADVACEWMEAASSVGGEGVGYAPGPSDVTDDGCLLVRCRAAPSRPCCACPVARAAGGAERYEDESDERYCDEGLRRWHRARGLM